MHHDIYSCKIEKKNYICLIRATLRRTFKRGKKVKHNSEEKRYTNYVVTEI